MKLWATLGTLLSLVVAAPDAADREARVPDRPSGFAVDGGAFYVWDEDRDEAERWAGELARTRAPDGG